MNIHMGHTDSVSTRRKSIHISLLSSNFLATNLYILLWRSYLVAFAHFCIFLWKSICENFLSLKVLILVIYISLGKYPFHLSLQFYLHRDQPTEKAELGDLSFLHRGTQLINGSLPICPNRNSEIISTEMDQKGKVLERLTFQSSSKIFPPNR